ncbi:MAG: MerR family transcriptional regulator [Salinisphaera sp.]|jgi:chaperone modulatory protein CbpM|nr:MerR family transcriptional regulator [Salinisphaera sp.]
MQDDAATTLTCEIIEEHHVLSLGQICRSCGVRADWVILLVDEGVLEPLKIDETHFQFTARHMRRLHTARRLQRDLGLDIAGIALALELMDEIRELRNRLQALGEPPVRR